MQQALTTCQEIGHRAGAQITLRAIGAAFHVFGQLGQAETHYRQVLEMAQELGLRFAEMRCLEDLSRLFIDREQAKQASQALEESLAIARELGTPIDEYVQLASLAKLHARFLHKPDKAREYYEQARALEKGFDSDLETGTVAASVSLSLIWVLLMQEEFEQALALVEKIWSQIEVQGLLRTFAANEFAYHTIYSVLAANGDPRADPRLEEVYDALQYVAQQIPDEAVQRSYLENVFERREIIRTYESQTPTALSSLVEADVTRTADDARIPEMDVSAQKQPLSDDTAFTLADNHEPVTTIHIKASTPVAVKVTYEGENQAEKRITEYESKKGDAEGPRQDIHIHITIENYGTIHEFEFRHVKTRGLPAKDAGE